MLERLPLEILQTIINCIGFCCVGNAASGEEQVSVQSDLKALCEVSKHLHQATVSKLYETITVLLDEVCLDHADLSCFYGDNMKVLIFNASFHINLKGRCAHNVTRSNWNGSGFEEDDDAEDKMMTRLTIVPSIYLVHLGWIVKIM